MKIKVHIDSVFQEETLQIQAPSRTPKIQQVVEFVESCLLYTSPSPRDTR